ncbi:MAG: transporter ATP-binding protein [Myxococcales bacterium]|nr:transporter ATP-binding protein [Myxococcales bacterium]
MGDPLGVRYIHTTKNFRQGNTDLPVLSGVNFEVGPGEFIALMGPSGSGKSTLLNLTAGIDKPTSGQVFVGSHDPCSMTETQLSDWRRQYVGFIFQRYHLLNVLTAAENVEVPLLLFKLSKAERRRRVHTALELVGLADRAKHYPKQLSGGEEQRVAIARTIVNDPALILADEPTGDLDTKSAEEILGLLVLLNQTFKKTIIMVTHDPTAAKYANRTLYLHKGVFSEIGNRELT